MITPAFPPVRRSRRTLKPVVVPAAALLALTITAAGALPAGAAAGIDTAADAGALGTAIQVQPGTVIGGAFVERPPDLSSTAVVSLPLAGFPTQGPDFALLTTGDPELLSAPNDSDDNGVDAGGPLRTDALDVTVLRLDLDVPADVNCLVGFDFKYFSEEFPEFVGSEFNDGFIAELDRTTWSTAEGVIQAPDNFAFDPDGNVISVNSTGVANVTPEAAAGTTYDAATQVLSAATPITPGPHSLYLSIFDQGDGIYDSAVAVDNLRFGTVSDPATECKAGVRPADEVIPTMTPTPSAPDTTVLIPTAVPAGEGGSGWTSALALPALMVLAVAGVVGTALVLTLRRS